MNAVILLPGEGERIAAGAQYRRYEGHSGDDWRRFLDVGGDFPPGRQQINRVALVGFCNNNSHHSG